jgi:thymidylate synthase
MTNSLNKTSNKQKILILQQKNRGISKINGIEKHGNNLFSIEMITIDTFLPPVLDDTSQYLPSRIDADIVLDFLIHPDLSHDLALLCRERSIPVIASGKKLDIDSAITPPT